MVSSQFTGTSAFQVPAIHRGGWITRSRDRDHPGQHGETPSLLKLQKISWAWWRVPVIPATQEAEAGELPERSEERRVGKELLVVFSFKILPAAY